MSQDDKTHEILQRLAVLETQVEDMEAKLNTVSNQLDQLLGEILKYRGVLGGILLAFSVITAGLTFFKDWGYKLFK